MLTVEDGAGFGRVHPVRRHKKQSTDNIFLMLIKDTLTLFLPYHKMKKSKHRNMDERKKQKGIPYSLHNAYNKRRGDDNADK